MAGENARIENRFNQLINTIEPMTNVELKECCQLLSRATPAMLHEHVLNKSQVRIEIELIRAIREFDRASADLVKTTNRLNSRLYALTWVMVGVGLLGALASAWPNLVWWAYHVFGLRPAPL